LSKLSAGNDTVVVSEPTAGLLRINLGAGAFAGNAATVAGLTYEVPGLPSRRWRSISAGAATP
jgi:hypothetical protein